MRYHRAMRFAVLSSALALLVGCAASREPEPPPPEPGDFVEDLLRPLGQLLCERRAACGCAARSVTGTIDVEQCTARFVERGTAANSTFIELGIVAERRHVREYLQDLERAPLCDDIEIEWERGLAYFPVDIGEECPHFGYCAGGLGACGASRCHPMPLEEGEACLLGACGAGLRCDDEDDICRRRSGEGEPCSALGGGCELGLRCVLDTCRRPLPAGSPCRRADDCDSLLACVDGQCTAGTDAPGWACARPSSERPLSRCRPRLAEGERCDGDRDCAASLFCSSGHCRMRGGPGESCRIIGGDSCQPGLYCHESVCAVAPGEGEPCGSYARCAPGVECISPTCRALPGEGEPCLDGRHCALPLACLADGICGALPEGSDCSVWPLCGPGTYCRRSSEMALCAPHRAAGDACRFEEECGGACLTDATSDTSCVPADGLLGSPCGEHEDCDEDHYCAPEPSCVAPVCSWT